MINQKPDRAEPRSLETLSFLAARVLGLAVSTLVSLFLVRRLSVEEFGLFSAATGVFLLISAFSYVGCDQLLLARRVNAEFFLWLVPRLGLLTALLGLAAATAWPGLAGDARLTLGLLALTRASDLQRGLWILGPQLDQKHLARARRELLGQVVIAAGVLAAVGLDASSVLAATGGLVGSLVLTISVKPRYRRACRTAADPSFVGAMKAGLGFATSSILYTSINASGLALIPLIATLPDVARFRAAMLVYAATLVIPVAVNNDVMRPHLYRSSGKEGGSAETLRSPLLAVNLLLGVGVGLMLLLVRPLVIPVLGEEYAAVGDLLVPLAAAAPCAFMSSYIANRLIVRGRLAAVVRSQAGLLLLAIGVNAVLIPWAGALGAARAVLVVESLGLVVYAIVWRRTPNFERVDG